jgi:hypothetical protein
MTAEHTTCRSCIIARYLEEESLIEWYGEDEADSILALAEMWHDKCNGECDCEVRKRERRILPRLRAFRRPGRGMHVPFLSRQLAGKEERGS